MWPMWCLDGKKGMYCGALFGEKNEKKESEGIVCFSLLDAAYFDCVTQKRM